MGAEMYKKGSGNSGGPVIMGDKKERATTEAEETLPTPFEQKETRWLRRAANLPYHKATDLNVLMGIWRVIGLAFQCLTIGENIGYVIPVSQDFVRHKKKERKIVWAEGSLPTGTQALCI
eukprot:47470-Pelagomonas_calceolata.AAC.1